MAQDPSQRALASSILASDNGLETLTRKRPITEALSPTCLQ